MLAVLERVLIGLGLTSEVYRVRATGRQVSQERNEQINRQAVKASQQVRDMRIDPGKDDDAVSPRLESEWVRSPGDKGGRRVLPACEANHLQRGRPVGSYSSGWRRQVLKANFTSGTLFV